MLVVKKSFFDNYCIQKGIKDTSKLVKKEITNKNGHRTTVWVRLDEPPKGDNHARPKTQEQNVSAMKRVAELKAKTERGDNILFEKQHREITGMVVAKGDDGVTAQKRAVAYQVPYESIKKNLTKEGVENPETFSAKNYAQKYMDYEINRLEKSSKGAGVKYFLEKYLPGKEGKEMGEKCSETEQRVKEQIAKEGQTINRYRISGEGKDAVYSEERQKLHKEIFDFYLSPEKIRMAQPEPGSKPKLVMLGGRAGAGKSWFTEKGKGGIYEEDVKNGKYIVLDADAIKSGVYDKETGKELCPPLTEYKGWNAGTVHEESSDLNKKLVEFAKKMNCNIIIDGTMASPEKTVKQIKEFKSAGYFISCDYMFTPMQESMKRACGRFKTRKVDYSGRFVPLGIMTNMTQNEDSFEAIKDLCDRYSFRDNYNQTNGNPTLVVQKGNY